MRKPLLALLWALSACSGSRVESEESAEFLDGEASAAFVERASWTRLGGELTPEPTDFVSGLSLSAAPRREPVLALSTLDSTTGAESSQVLRWTGSEWLRLAAALPEGGPSLAVASSGRLYACTGEGPLVRRWNGTRWIAVGGNISVETGAQGTRYQVERCGGIVLDGSDTPLVAWTAHRGPKADSVHAARWSAERARWEALGSEGVPVRAPYAYLDIDARDRPYLATFSPGGSYGGGATTRVFRFGGDSFSQLGGDLPGSDQPVIGLYDNTPYLALTDSGSGELRLLRWQGATWSPLPSPGRGSGAVLGFSLSGKPIIAYVDAGAATVIRVAYYAGGRWQAVGDGVAEVTDAQVSLALAIDARGLATVAWSAADPTGSDFHVYASRYGAAIP